MSIFDQITIYVNIIYNETNILKLRSKFDLRYHNKIISEKKINAKRLKKEYNSAIKEIRKDNKFIARIYHSENMAKYFSKLDLLDKTKYIILIFKG